MALRPYREPLVALVAGAATILGFAPFEWTFLPVATLGIFFALLSTATPREAAWRGFAFGAGLFGAGVSWVYVALDTFGATGPAVGILATAGFCAALALYPAAVGWGAARLTPPAGAARALAAAGAWAFAEWLRGFLFTGFTWLSVGYASLPQTGGNVFAGYAPVGGVYAVSLAMSLCAASLALALREFRSRGPARATALLLPIAAIAAAGFALARIEWTAPTGRSTAVSLVQGDVPEERKFDPAYRQPTFDLYTELAQGSRGRLVILPESAFPMFDDEVPEAVYAELRRIARERSGDLLVGLFTIDAPATPDGLPRFYNTVLSLGTAPDQRYRKRHLVPFGETIPFDSLLGDFLRNVMSIPLTSQSPGDPDPPPLQIAGEHVAVDICFEDAFGADIRTQAAAATLLVNVTNDAWYGRSLAAPQHSQIAAMRALETGRPLARATNTGITAAFDHRGREIARLAWYTRGVLEVELAGRTGSTPYVRFGDPVAAALAAALLAGAALARRRRSEPPARRTGIMRASSPESPR